jgi:2-oxoglutarate dehydrogenase E2 component (dihydrolipoamide succinyltransferase)
MPQLGETVVEGTITKWLKKEGDSVARDEPLFEISTDKVDTEVPSPLAGTVVSIKVLEGETVKVGTELAIIDAGGDGQVAATPASKPEPTPEPEAAASPPAEPAALPATPAPEGQAEAPADANARSGILSPLVRRLAEEHGINLSQVPGTGTGGRITKKDVMDYVERRGEHPPMPQPEPVPEPLPQPQPMPQPEPMPPLRVAAATREEAIPLSRMRRSIAANMVASIQTSARAWNLTEVNMESIVRTRTAAKDSFQAREGIALTYMPFVARAVCDALLAYPDVNSELREEELVRKHYVNLGIAVALDDGLIVPVVKGADVMNIVGLARAINDVATRARNKKLNPDDVHGGTFTITNPGPFGSIISVPIINPPQCAILAFDAIEKRPVVIDDAIAIRHMVYLSMSWDHRIIDGATAAKFLARVKQNLETWDFGPEVGLPAR